VSDPGAGSEGRHHGEEDSMMSRERDRGPLRPFATLLPVLLLGLCLGCPTDQDDDDDTTADCVDPEISHEPVADGMPANTAVDIEAMVSDDTGISTVSLYFRTAGTDAWSFAYMFETEQTGTWIGSIGPSVVVGDGVDYYVRAVDDGNPRCEASSPATAPDDYYHFDVDILGAALPFVEDWEDGSSLGELGWSVVVEGFGDYEWQLSSQEALSGTTSVMHKEGINDIPVLQDWLISPAIEFSTATEVAVNWWELGKFTSDLEVHQLYLSMGSPDPDDGDFVLVADLEPPTLEAWGPSDLHDITDLIDDAVGFIAFYYQGEYPADRWFIDDVYVGEPVPRFELTDVSVTPGAFGPGDSIDLTLEVTNVSVIDSDPITATLTSADALLDTGDPVDHGVIAADEASTGDGEFTVTVEAAHVNNALLSFELRLDDGAHSWDLPFSILMGAESYVQVVYDATASGALVLTAGYGDVAAPTFAVTTEVDDASSWSETITTEALYLPPAAGENRWWLKIDNQGLYPATVTAFGIDWGGTPFASSQLPVEVLAADSAVIYLPPMPTLEATAVATVPIPLEPGDTGVSLIVQVTNQGPVDTAGPLTGTLGSTDPDVSNVTGMNVAMGTDALAPGESASNQIAFGFDVSAAHTDDTDLELTLAVSDGVDDYDVPIRVEVPWAHVSLEEFILDDSAGNGDAILDRGETVLLGAAFRNDGDYATAGTVEVTIAQSPTSQATVNVLDDHEDLGVVIDAGQPVIANAAFEIEIVDGYMGDLVALDVVITDGVDTWTETWTAELTQRAWSVIPGAVDALGDANGYMFDIDSLSYKSDGEVLWLRIDSHTPFDIPTLFLHLVFYDVPHWWRLQFVYEEFTIWDDWFDGWFVGSEVVLGVPPDWTTEADGGTYSFLFRLLLADLEVDGQSLRMGMFAGSCPFIYYCDTEPDGWFELDLKNAQYSQNSNLLWVYSW